MSRRYIHCKTGLLSAYLETEPGKDYFLLQRPNAQYQVHLSNYPLVNFQMVLGWDSPLATYYAQLWLSADTGEFATKDPNVWIGVQRGALPTVNDLYNRLNEWIPGFQNYMAPQFSQVLIDDKEHEGVMKRAPLLENVLQILEQEIQNSGIDTDVIYRHEYEEEDE